MKDRGIEVIQSEKEFTAHVLRNKKPVLIMFMAKWCGAGQIMHPTVEQIRKSFDGRLEVFEINVDDHQGFRARYNILEIPTFQVFIRGKIIDRFSGLKPRKEFVEWLSGLVDHFEKRHQHKTSLKSNLKILLL